MKHRTFPKMNGLVKLMAVALLVLLSPFALLAQGEVTSTPQKLTLEQFAGRYRGSAKSPTRNLTLILEIRTENERVSGKLVESSTEQDIISGEVVGGKLVLHLQGITGAGRLTLQVHGGQLSGEWVIASGEWTSTGGKPGVIQFEEVTETSDEISGDWDAAADAQGQAFPFTLSLKLEGEKVTGSSNSELGNTTISSGVWKEGKLVLVLELGSGRVGLVATLQDGKLVGDYDFAGQMQGKWVGVKKNE